MMIAKVNSKTPDQIKLEDFILEFETRKSTKNLDPSVQALKAKMNKNAFLASLGVGRDVPQKKTIPGQKKKTQRRLR